MKKIFLLTSAIFFVLLSTFSVFASNSTITNTNLISNTNGYTFECVITPDITAECIPIISMYDNDGFLCGLMYGDTISLTSGTKTVETFKVDSASTPSFIKLMLWKSDGTLAPLCNFEQVPTSLCSEKFGMITELYDLSEVEIFSADGSYDTYTLDNDVILSHAGGVITDKASAANYIDSLKFSYYTRSKQPASLWKIFEDERTCFKDTTTSSSAVYKYPDFFDNYTKRVARFLISSDNKIMSVAFADDKLYNNLSSEETYTSAFYEPELLSFNGDITLSDNATVLYLPAKKGLSESDYEVKNLSQLKAGNRYHAKVYTANEDQLILMTYMLTDEEVTNFNNQEDKLTHISTGLNGDGKTIVGINTPFYIDLPGQTDEDNEAASYAANEARKYVVEGLKGALEAANNGYAITRELVKIKFRSEINAAKAHIKELQELDKRLSSKYYDEFINKMALAAGEEAATFLKSYFIDN